MAFDLWPMPWTHLYFSLRPNVYIKTWSIVCTLLTGRLLSFRKPLNIQFYVQFNIQWNNQAPPLFRHNFTWMKPIQFMNIYNHIWSIILSVKLEYGCINNLANMQVFLSFRSVHPWATSMVTITVFVTLICYSWELIFP